MANYSGRASALSERDMHLQRYRSSRFDLLFMILLTLVNLILVIAGGSTYFLFSAFVPYQMALIGYILSGMMPDDFYVGDWADTPIFDSSLFYVLFAVALVILAVYALLWYFSRNGKGGFLVAALVLFSIDTAAMFMLGGISTDTIIDLALHAWVIYDIARGVHAWHKLQALPEEAPAVAEGGEAPAAGLGGQVPAYTGLLQEIWAAYESGEMKERLSASAEVLFLGSRHQHEGVDSLVDGVLARNGQEIAFGLDEQSISLFVSCGTNSKNPEQTIPLSEIYDLEDLYSKIIAYVYHNS